MTLVSPPRAITAVVVVAALGALGLDLPTLDEAVAWLSRYPAIVVLALITVTGETVVLAAVVVAVEGDWSLAEVVLWCFVGTVASDAVWFRLAAVVDGRWARDLDPDGRSARTLAWLRERTGTRPYLALLYVKFLYGSRFLMLVYLATRRIPLGRFLLYDAVGTAVWLAVLVPAGWLVARGVVSATDVGRLDLVVLALVAVLLLLRGGSSWLTTRARRRSAPSSPPTTRRSVSPPSSRRS